MATWQFVADMASASPTVSLDINTGSLMVGDGWNLDPAKYTKGYAASPLRRGQRPTNSVPGNRILTIPIQVLAADQDAAATAVQNLGLQIAKDNILKVQFGSTPVFFRTYADPDQAIEVTKTLTQLSKITLQIEAEPDAYGPRVSAGTFTVSNDPANGTNPCRFDITGVLGDVPTPLLLVSTTTGSSGLVNKWSHISTRRRGTPSNYSNLVQAEDMTNGTDASDVVDAAFSGGNKVRISFGTNTSITPVRLSDTFPGNGTSTVEARGEYRVYGRMAMTTGTDTITVKLGYGTSSSAPIFNDAKVLPNVTNAVWVDLGLVPVPMFSDPVTSGYSGVATKAVLPFVGLYASRTGSGNLDVDCLMFMPADDQTLICKFPSTDTTYAIDGTTAAGGSVYGVTTALDEVISTASAPQITGGAGFPELIPGQTNRIHFLRNVDPTGTADALTNTTSFAAYYWPRWREFTRP